MTPPYDVQERAFTFACDVIVFCRKLRHRDFIAKAAISRKESRESRFWLRLIAFAEPNMCQAAAPLIDESTQLYKILTTIILNAQSNDRRGE